MVTFSFFHFGLTYGSSPQVLFQCNVGFPLEKNCAGPHVLQDFNFLDKWEKFQSHINSVY